MHVPASGNGAAAAAAAACSVFFCRAGAQVEDPKRALLVYGNKTSQVVKDVMTDLHKLKGVRRWAGLGVPAAASYCRHQAHTPAGCVLARAERNCSMCAA